MFARLRDRLRYGFDNVMSRGAAAMIAALFMASLFIIIPVCLFVAAMGLDPEGRSLAHLLWASLMLMVDAGSIAADTGTWAYDLAMFLVVLGGIFLMSAIIGVLTTCIEARLERLRKGRSRVIETGHTVILGWSHQVFRIINELLDANENQKRCCIVVLAEKDKTEMEDEIRERISKSHTRIVCRTGSPIDMNDLEIVSPHSAKSIILLAPPGRDPDAYVIKTILALTNSPEHLQDRYCIVATVRAHENVQVARMVGGQGVYIVQADDVAARIAAQVCRQSGLSAVWTDLLDFKGDEVYFQEECKLVGKDYAYCVQAYDTSSVIGIRHADGTVSLNPPTTTIFAEGEQVIAISRDDDTVILSENDGQLVDEASIRCATHDAKAVTPERFLLLGWNHRGESLLQELDRYVAAGSTVKVVADAVWEAPDASRRLSQVSTDHRAPKLDNLTREWAEGRTTDRKVLDALDIPANFDHVLVLSNIDHMSAQEADALTLVTLLHLRDIADSCSHRFSIVSEILDTHNRDLAQVTQADDFVVSDELISLLLSQISENVELEQVFGQLLDARGAELYLKPIEEYVKLDVPVTFYTVVASAIRRGETAVGYREQQLAHNYLAAYGVCLNPDKANEITFAAGDRVIVLAED